MWILILCHHSFANDKTEQCVFFGIYMVILKRLKIYDIKMDVVTLFKSFV